MKWYREKLEKIAEVETYARSRVAAAAQMKGGLRVEFSFRAERILDRAKQAEAAVQKDYQEVTFHTTIKEASGMTHLGFSMNFDLGDQMIQVFVCSSVFG